MQTRLKRTGLALAIALIGLACTLLAMPSVFPRGGPVNQSPDAAAARYLIWHLWLLAATGVALAGVIVSLTLIRSRRQSTGDAEAPAGGLTPAAELATGEHSVS